MNLTLVLGELIKGFGKTLLLFATTLIVAIPLGLLFALCARSKFKPLKYLVKGLIWVIRSTPLMLQVLFVSFVPYYGFNILNKQLAGFLGVEIHTLTFIFIAIAFALNYACYYAEIFRGGLEAVDDGQLEAGASLGLTKFQVMIYIVLPQGIRHALPSLFNEFIALVNLN